MLHDDDDLWHPAFLEATVRWLDDHPDDIGVTVRTEIIYEAERDGRFQEVGRAPFWPRLTAITYAELLQVNRFVPISYLYRRSLHDDVGMYREDIHAAEDWELNLRTALRHHIGLLGGEPSRTGCSAPASMASSATACSRWQASTIATTSSSRPFATRRCAPTSSSRGPGPPRYISLGSSRTRSPGQLDERQSLGQRLTGAVRDWRRERRTR